MRVTLIDFGATNLPSVERALQHLSASTERATVPEQITAATALVLPGAGSFAGMMRVLETQQMIAPIRDALARKAPFLGIALGMHALFEGSAEEPQHAGFAVFPGRVLPLSRNAQVPHLGWNRVQHVRPGRLLRNVSEKDWFYFAHTFAVPAASASPATSGRVLEMRPTAPKAVEHPASASAVCHHGGSFVAVAEAENVFAVQFRPEKSGDAGMDVLRNFLEAAR